ncbi:MAG: hypothetical protein H6659_05210 [Ardenticatenaceae bacterium]|nr:hypothetical protein [Ardenticatenaceae bacterium]MCB8988438.1 hypothetical protein [Ardenticatenaceae bacterium]
MMHKLTDARTVIHFNGVPVNVRPIFWIAPPTMWLMLTWLAGKRRPERSLGQRLLVALLGLPFPFLADVGHALAHTESAKRAGAPMDQVLLSLDMPRTLYNNNDVTPAIHRQRSLGGPIYSAASLLGSLLWRALSAPDSLSRELADIACLSHGFILTGALLPLPIVDGGVILKWTLVEQGYTPEDANAVVKKAGVLSLALLSGVITWLLWSRREAIRRFWAANGRTPNDPV